MTWRSESMVNLMNTDTDQCNHLRRLQVQLSLEIQDLRDSIRQAEKEGADTSIETLNSLKHLQASLSNVTLELEKCPPDNDTSAPQTVRARTSGKRAFMTEQEVADVEEEDTDEGEFESVVDEP